MSIAHRTWQEWEDFFMQRSRRSLPALEQDRDYSALPDSLARSLAIFQLGESGGGTIVAQSFCNSLPGLNNHFGTSMAYFVEEEHRHANILAICVRLLGGTLIRSNWTAHLFVFARRLIGLRLKVVVLLAAEVVGLCYYHLLAVRLPPSRLRDQLLEIVEDERAHLYFHCDFLRSQTRTRWRKRVFVMVWRTVMASAALVVAIDHRHAIRDLDIGFRPVLARWRSYSRLAEMLVVSDSARDCEHAREIQANSSV
tara:strand:+ start:13193 stop:13954 length:762 start_codon:yes stop_codon:yes gene_type:complete